MKLLDKIFGRKKDMISFRDAMGLCSLPVITLYQGSNQLHFLLDTGATNSVVDSSILDNVDHEMVNFTTTLYGIEGKPQKVNACSITLYYNDKAYTYGYLIQNLKEAFAQMKKETGVTLHGIIGSNFFNEFKYVLDFKELVAYSKQ